GTNKPAGSATSIYMDGGPDAAALLAWDLSSIPAGSIVESVRIDLYVTNASRVAYPAYALLQPWSNDATWAATGTGSFWDSAGALGLADRGPLMGEFSALRKGAATFTLDAGGVDVVQSWIDNPDANHGLVFQNYHSSDGIIIVS